MHELASRKRKGGRQNTCRVAKFILASSLTERLPAVKRISPRWGCHDCYSLSPALSGWAVESRPFGANTPPSSTFRLTACPTGRALRIQTHAPPTNSRQSQARLPTCLICSKTGTLEAEFEIGDPLLSERELDTEQHEPRRCCPTGSSDYRAGLIQQCSEVEGESVVDQVEVVGADLI